MLVHELKQTIRQVADFPKPGINFYDVATLFRNGRAFSSVIERMVGRFKGQPLDALVGIEARGFVLAAAMANELDLGLVLARKSGKLPGDVESESYDLEYGTARLEIQKEALESGHRVVIVDDLLATGGTAAATGRLVSRSGARLEGYAFMVELGFLDGRKRLGTGNLFSLLHYD